MAVQSMQWKPSHSNSNNMDCLHIKPLKSSGHDLLTAKEVWETMYHMEHLNRACKTTIAGVGVNVSEKSIDRAAKAYVKVKMRVKTSI